MSARRMEMHRIQEAIRLHRLGESRRSIARRLHMGRPTIQKHFDALKLAHLLDGSPDDLPSTEILRTVVDEHLPSPLGPPRSSVDPWLSKILELRERDAQPTAIHDYLRLQVEGYDGSLSAVKRLCRRLDRERGPLATDVAIPVLTAPGEVAQVDFGYSGLRFDDEQKILRKSWVFVMVLGFSRHMFCKIVFDQKIETWIALHIEAFAFFGAVPRILVPDNLKSAVIRAAFGIDQDAVLNRTYRELARYYGFQIDPTPPRSPEKKGKVEAGVRYVRRNFLKTWETQGVIEDNRQLRRWVLEIAGRRLHPSTGRTPLDLFEKERSDLLPLPNKKWESVVWKKATLHRDSHVQVDGAFYSAPWRHLGKSLWVRCTEHSIELFREDEHLHTHGRIGRGQRHTVEEHIPEHRRDLRNRGRDYWIERGRKIGAEVEDLATRIFDSDDVLFQLRKVQAVVTHLEKFPPQRARSAAARALHFGCLDYRALKNILVKGLDLKPLPNPSEKRAWSKGSRFARCPSEFSFMREE